MNGVSCFRKSYGMTADKERFREWKEEHGTPAWTLLPYGNAKDKKLFGKYEISADGRIQLTVTDFVCAWQDFFPRSEIQSRLEVSSAVKSGR